MRKKIYDEEDEEGLPTEHYIEMWKYWRDRTDEEIEREKKKKEMV